ncbi:hypothetical protein RUND412_001373 [Rhizina undulata]
MGHAKTTAAHGPSMPQNAIEEMPPPYSARAKAFSSEEAAAGFGNKAKKRGRGKASKARYKDSRKEKRGGQTEASPASSPPSANTNERSVEVVLSSPSQDYKQSLLQTRVAMSALGNAISSASTSDELPTNDRTIAQVLAASSGQMEIPGMAHRHFPEALTVSQAENRIQYRMFSEFPLFININVESEDVISVTPDSSVLKDDVLSLFVQGLGLGASVDASTMTHNVGETGSFEDDDGSFRPNSHDHNAKIDASTMTEEVGGASAETDDKIIEAKSANDNSNLELANNAPLNRKVTRAEVEASNKEAREFVRREMAKILEQHEKQSAIDQAEHAKWRHDFAQRQRLWRWAKGASTYHSNEALAKIAGSSTAESVEQLRAAKESHQESLTMKARLVEEKKRLEAKLLVLQQREKMEIEEMRERKEKDQRELEAMLEKTQGLQALLAGGFKYDSVLGLDEGSSVSLEVPFDAGKSLKVTESQIKNALDDVASYLRTMIQSWHEKKTEVQQKDVEGGANAEVRGMSGKNRSKECMGSRSEEK